MSGIVYAKTDKGRDEIATRRFRLPARPRALLLLIDGERSLATLVQQFGAAGATEDNAAVLLQGGFIAPVRKAVVQLADAPVATLPTPPASAQDPQRLPSPQRAYPQQAEPASQEPVSMHDIYSARRLY